MSSNPKKAAVPKKLTAAGIINAPTSRYTHSFLNFAWKNRATLQPDERRGYGQYFYIVLCGHLELYLVRLVENQRTALVTLSVPNESFDGPLTRAARAIIDRFANNALNASLSDLKKFFEVAYSTDLKAALGDSLYADLDALGAVRNVVAHSRDLRFTMTQFEGDKDTTVEAGKEITKAIQVLKREGIKVPEKMTGENYDEFFEVLFGDDALRYFHGSVQKIEVALTAAVKAAGGPQIYLTPKLGPLA